MRCDVGRHNENFLFLQKKMRYCVCLSKELSSNTNPQERKIFRRIIKMVHTQYGITGCLGFNLRLQNWKDFLPKTQQAQRKLLNFENWCNREVSKKLLDLTFKVNFLCQNSSELFLNFFFIELHHFRSPFFVIDIF